MDIQKLLEFYQKAALNTYIGGGAYEKVTERPDFRELVFIEGDWFYRDSYTGVTRSWGTEVIRFENKPVWCAEYGGGMILGKEQMADDTFKLLVEAMSHKPKDIFSARGPNVFQKGEWKYSYQQEGEIENFHGYERIEYKGELVFEHRIIGGIIKY